MHMRNIDAGFQPFLLEKAHGYCALTFSAMPLRRESL
jgi:hypothetical protein